MNKEQYDAYLKTPEWAEKRAAVDKRSHGRCERCLWGLHEETHHLRYDFVGSEPLDDLKALCRACHECLHKIQPFDPTKATKEEYEAWYIGRMTVEPEVRAWARFVSMLDLIGLDI